MKCCVAYVQPLKTHLLWLVLYLGYEDSATSYSFQDRLPIAYRVKELSKKFPLSLAFGISCL